MLLKFKGTATTGYNQITSCLVVEPIISVVKPFSYTNPIEGGTDTFNSNNLYIGLMETSTTAGYVPVNAYFQYE